MKIDFENTDIEALAGKVADLLKPLLSEKRKDTAEDIIFDVQGIADYLKVDVSWIYKKVSLKEIPHFHIGKYPRFRRSQIDRWIDTQTVRPVPLLKNEKYRMGA